MRKRKSLKTAHEKIAELSTKVDTLKTNLREVTEANVNLEKTSGNNLKYLINLDRNSRRSNVILFGVSETEDLVINEVSARSDKEKIDALLKFIEVHEEVEVLRYYRLGKEPEGEERRRPVKVELKNSEMVSLILANAKKLRPLNQKLFFKPDKTKKEREEYQRLLKKKETLMLSHPTEEGAPDRVVLAKGVLTVDGAVNDRYMTLQTLF